MSPAIASHKMVKSIALFAFIFALFLTLVFPSEYPECKHGGARVFTGGRSTCQCPRNRVNTGPLCEAVRVNFEKLQTPLIAVRNLDLSLPLHISLEFISKDFRGTGVLLSLGDHQKGGIFELALNYGQPVIAVNARSQTANVGSLHDNQWHHVDLFLSQTPISVEVVLIVDRCIDKWRCGRKLVFNGISAAFAISGPLTFGSASADGHRLQELCMENIVLNSALEDFWEAIATRPLAQGCPKCEEACFFSEAINDTGRCGDEGICRNPIVAATDQYVCTCRPGFQPQANLMAGNPVNTSAPCIEPVVEWQINGPYSFDVNSRRGLIILLGLRTRQLDTPVLRSRDGRVRLAIVNGGLEFRLDYASLALPNVGMADGLWHTIKLTITPIIQGTTSRMVELSVDGLWGPFSKATLLNTAVISTADLDDVFIIESVSSCMSDLRLGTRDSRNNIIYTYLPSVTTEQRQPPLQRGCETEDLCAAPNPCGLHEICVPQWRGKNCTCETGFSHRVVRPSTTLQCVRTSCEPNPCHNGGECFVLANETISFANQTVGVVCECPGAWTGLFCESPPLAKSSLQNWWLIPVSFVLILIVFWIVFIVCWLKRRKLKKMAATIPGGSRLVEQQERMNVDGVVKAGEEDYHGSLDLSSLKAPEVSLRQGHLTVRKGSLETRTADSMLSAEGERFLAMDQPLQYAFEGYDTSPPPAYFLNNNANGRFEFFKRTT